MLKYDRQSRRMFLIGAGKLAIAVPLMNSLLPKAFAQSAIARRYVQVFGYSGVNPWDYWPKDLAATKIGDHVYSQSLASVIAKYGKVSRIIGSDFNPIINKMSILQGLDILTNDGWGTHTYTAPANAAMNYFDGEYSGAVSYQYSIDCILEDAKKFYATTPRMGALRLFNDGDTLGDVQVGTGPIGSMRPGNGYIHPLQPGYTKTTDPRFIPPSPDAATAFRQALGGISTGGGGGSTTNPETVIRQLSSSTLTQEYQRVVNSRKISSDDKQLLSNYMDLLNQFNKSLQASVPVATMC